MTGIAGLVAGPAQSTPADQTLAAIRECMARVPAPWPEAWEREYVDTIREAITLHQDAPQYARRLQMLGRGFQSYWENLKKDQDRSLFDVSRAEIRWYIESLLGTEFPTDDDREKLRDQYRDLWDYAARALLAQFPFLDPNAIQKAKADDLGECCRGVETPLLPIFLCPFSEIQMGRIRLRWEDLRYARVDLWRQLGADATVVVENSDAPSLTEHRHYLLTRRSLNQLRQQIWIVTARAPEYYRRAVDKEIDAHARRFRSRVHTRSQDIHVEATLLQLEHISFMMGALLETAECAQAIGAYQEDPFKDHGGTEEGGDAYDLGNASEDQ